jgi:hypothetical protein
MAALQKTTNLRGGGNNSVYILAGGKWQLPRIAIIAVLLIVLVATPLMALPNSAPVSASSEAHSSTPVFPSPQPWFDWGQRTINGVMRTGIPFPVADTYLKGFGNYEPDIIVGGEPYKANIVMAPMPVAPYSMTVVSRAYLQSVGDPWQLHWYMRGSWDPSMSLPGTIFDGDLLNFEYPLYLGKTWNDATTVTPYPGVQLPVTTEAVAVAYIEPVLNDDGSVATYNVVVADGCEYQLPDLNSNGVLGDDVGAVPSPRKQLGDISWTDMKAMPDSDAQIGWNNVVVPAGPCAGENIQGYYAVKQTITTMSPPGYPVSRISMEAWKDVRGCVPVQIVERGQLTSSGWTTQTTMTIARRWTGNFAWFQYEFGGLGRTFGVRVDDTAIGEGGHTFQFATPGKDFGLKDAGDAMTVDMDRGLVTIDYEDAYISCDAAMYRILGNLWFGIARIKDLATGHVYLVAGIT